MKSLFGWGPRLGISGGVLLALLGVQPLAREREQQARTQAPSSISLAYLELSSRWRPADDRLRLDLVERVLAAGSSARARELLEPLLRRAGVEAQLLRVEIDRSELFAKPAGQRANELARLLRDVRAIELARLAPEQAERLAEVCLEAGVPSQAAIILDELARRPLPDFERRIAAADRAHLAAGQPQLSAALHADWSARLAGGAALSHALAALERTQAGLGAPAALALFQRLRARWPSDPAWLAAGLALAEASDPRAAFQLAGALVQLQPWEAEHHRRLLRIALWTGDGLRALDEALWLARRSGRQADLERALTLAREHWDLRAVRELRARRARHAAPARPRRPRARCDGGGKQVIQADSEVFAQERLMLVSGRLRVEHRARGYGLRGRLRYAHVLPGPGLSAGPREVVRDVAAELGGRLAGSSLWLGVLLRDGRALLPSAGFEQDLLPDSAARLRAQARVFDTAEESGPLRLLAVQHELALEFEVPLPFELSLGARVAGQRLLTHDFGRWRRLADSLIADAGLGRSIAWARLGGVLDVRVVARSDAWVRSPWLQEQIEHGAGAGDAVALARAAASLAPHAAFVGAAVSLLRGDLQAPLVAAGSWTFAADASLGCLVPQPAFGWSMRVGWGVSVAGYDQLSIAMRAGNLLQLAPGFEFWTVLASYAVGLPG